MKIASRIDGRVRIRGDQLKDPSTVENLREILLTHTGVEEVSANRNAGSLLILYHPASTSPEAVMGLITASLKVEEQTEGRKAPGGASESPAVRTPWPVLTPSTRTWVRRGLLGSLAASLLGAALDVKKLHVAAGLGFLGILGVHLYDKRRLLFR